MTLADIQTVTNIIQNVTLTGATFIAAWWAYTTLGYKEKTDELLAIARKVVEIHSHIEGSASTYDLHKTLVGLGAFDDKKLSQVKQVAEARLEALRYELNDLRDLSLRLPVAFRLLSIVEYQLVIELGGIEGWNDEMKKKKLTQAKLKILGEIYQEINAHRNFLTRVYIKIQNTIYRF